MKLSDDSKLLTVAASISDGAGVDWGHVREDDPEADILRQLEILDRIATVLRSHLPGETETDEHHERLLAQPLGTWSHFMLIERLGEGAFGTVYRARDTRLQADVALKLLPLPDGSDIDPTRALKEARLLARVRHPNVVTVYGADIVDNQVGIWMEVVTGCTLSTWLANQGQLGAREAALVGLDLCRALAAVHRAGLVHGDVKARNVMRAAGGRTVLMDFGTGKDLHAARPATDAVSDLAGTPLYLAPEVFAGASRTTSTDIYSLGVLLFHLVTTKYPVDGATELEVEQTHQRGARTRLRDARPDLPDGFVHTIERAISVDPGERYRTAGEFEADLAAFLGQRGDRPASPFRSMWLAAALLAIVLAGGTSTTLLRWRNVPAIRGTASPVPADRTAATAASSYAIDTGFYTERERQETRLRFGDRVAPGDTLYAKLRVSVPAYVYIVNEDDRGESYLLFPLPGQSVRNPLPANSTIRIPGTRDDNRVSWKITSAGGREHFLVFASPDRLQEFEDMFAALPHAEFDKPVQTAKLPAQTLGRLRGVGGLAADHAAAPARLAGLFTRPLADGEETAQGVWVRQLTLDNPAPR